MQIIQWSEMMTLIGCFGGPPKYCFITLNLFNLIKDIACDHYINLEKANLYVLNLFVAFVSHTQRKHFQWRLTHVHGT